jgi:Zn finger protein HypA/HybF involved in hydrogenase expression
MAKKYKSDDLIESILSEHSITCDKCKDTLSEYNTDEYFFSERLFNLGWRVTNSNTYCPKCASKKLKQ